MCAEMEKINIKGWTHTTSDIKYWFGGRNLIWICDTTIIVKARADLCDHPPNWKAFSPMNKNRTELYKTMAVFLNPLNNSSSKPGRISQPKFFFFPALNLKLGREEILLGNQNLSDYYVEVGVTFSNDFFALFKRLKVWQECNINFYWNIVLSIIHNASMPNTCQIPINWILTWRRSLCCSLCRVFLDI